MQKSYRFRTGSYVCCLFEASVKLIGVDRCFSSVTFVISSSSNTVPCQVGADFYLGVLCCRCGLAVMGWKALSWPLFLSALCFGNFVIYSKIYLIIQLTPVKVGSTTATATTTTTTTTTIGTTTAATTTTISTTTAAITTTTIYLPRFVGVQSK